MSVTTKSPITVFGAARKAGTYLYLPTDMPTDELPKELLQLLGELRVILEIEVSPDRQLARCTGAEVLEGISDKGYYLQIPPSEYTPHDDPH
ncbi:YcgL domain-containing protein [Luminiphilus sp.]|nr:YcgL domain-containing protein [Luminiphilus sp.]MDA8738509.1 YcgL domain-containing protein [Luminiphilus sp.]MDA8754988.1 YcgL domain-containing protein [Luminiphilus sp.]MDB2313845.1 YcgL domain-containing protein [Luminiphilus sp.]MDB2316603.1 YcgL domain-containing protein [Luminiphilus sp.]